MTKIELSTWIHKKVTKEMLFSLPRQTHFPVAALLDFDCQQFVLSYNLHNNMNKNRPKTPITTFHHVDFLNTGPTEYKRSLTASLFIWSIVVVQMIAVRFRFFLETMV